MRNIISFTAAALVTGLAFLPVTGALAQQSTAPATTAPEEQASADHHAEADCMGSSGWWGHGGGEHGRGGHGRPMMMLDTNADGVVGAEEAAMMVDMMFGRLDQNQDDSLDETEFTAAPHGHKRGGWFGWGATDAEGVATARKEKFAAMDQNKDGKVSRVEFLANAEQRLAAADGDKDGKVTPWELRAHGRPW